MLNSVDLFNTSNSEKFCLVLYDLHVPVHCISKTPFQASKNDVKENGIGDESMEVDGVKKSPTAPKVPSLKKQASFQSALSVLQQMVNEYDDQGFTPLLLACEMYMNYRKPPKRNDVSLHHLHRCAFLIFMKGTLNTKGTII